MTLEAIIPLTRFSGNGTSTVFAPQFPAYSLDDIDIEVFDDDDDQISVTRDGSGTYDYVITGNLDSASELYESIRVTFNTAPPSGYTIGVARTGDQSQDLDLSQGGNLPSESLEIRLNKIYSLIQDLQDQSNRSRQEYIGQPKVVDMEQSRVVNALDPVDSTDLVTKRFLAANVAAAAVTAASMAQAVVSSRTALKALDTSTTTEALVTGADDAGDGGGGHYFFSSTSTDTANDGTVIQPDVGSGRWLLLFWGRLNVKVFGAKGDDATDDIDAFTAAENWLLTTGRRGAIYAPPGIYCLSSTFTLRGLSIGLEGDAGETCTELKGTGTTGAVVRIQGRGAWLMDIEVTSDATRKAASAADCYGVWIETTDSVGVELNDVRLEGVYVRDQPNTCVLLAGPLFSMSIRHCVMRDSQGGHGVQMDNGTATSRTNKGLLGNIEIEHCRIFDCEGHAILIGNDDDGISNRVIRPRIYNCDIGRCAQSAGSRKTVHQIWAFASNGMIMQSGVNGLNQAGDTVTTNLLLLHGPNWKVLDLRAVEALDHAIRFDVISTFETSGTVDGIYCVQTLGSALNPAVDVQSGVTWGVSVHTGIYDDIERLITDGVVGQWKRAQVFHKVNTQSVDNSTTLEDDDDLKCTLLARERVQFKAKLFFDSSTTADIKIAFVVPSGAAIAWGPVGGIKIDPSTGNVVAQDAVEASATDISFGSGAGVTRCIDIQGHVLTQGTAGDLQLQFAQNALDAVTPARLLNGSSLEVMR